MWSSLLADPLSDVEAETVELDSTSFLSSRHSSPLHIKVHLDLPHLLHAMLFGNPSEGLPAAA